ARDCNAILWKQSTIPFPFQSANCAKVWNLNKHPSTGKCYDFFKLFRMLDISWIIHALLEYWKWSIVMYVERHKIEEMGPPIAQCLMNRTKSGPALTQTLMRVVNTYNAI
ncbi:hypothetical protein KC19_12G146700, partial [Ceratodon purpureus]